MSGGSNSLRLEHQGMCVGLLLSCVSTEGRIYPRRGERISYKLCLLRVQFSLLLVKGVGAGHTVTVKSRKRDKPLYIYSPYGNAPSQMLNHTMEGF